MKPKVKNWARPAGLQEAAERAIRVLQRIVDDPKDLDACAGALGAVALLEYRLLDAEKKARKRQRKAEVS